ncbi:transmembrane protein, putative (macronuclear) [Tetrahymena thermophila SB210]|uniref:Transmembrane protein, putative n=1 Tax=Tetrahymena thermophila (strain SB210) TaxID=312017 RepID=Q23FN0_TETTS|nr:transmembrane protein, putative [Tetrahymena thermophila SB210]EAR95580.2 transmembrane protein, putative [Tetrahymena thermophila SB210]|eukprot:XP_001015825.2 transmembrane protein, putative [Tetrahymena thermophila SB210]
MSNIQGYSKIEELRNLEKIYTQSKQQQNKNTKFKEFDLSYKDFYQYNDLVSKQKILDEKNFYKKIQMGQSKNNKSVEEDSSSEEEEKESESLFEQEKDKYEEHIDSTQAESLLQDFYEEEENKIDPFTHKCNDEYNINLKKQRIAYYSLIALIGLTIIQNLVQLIDSFLQVDPKDAILQEMKYYSPYLKFLEFSCLLIFAQQIGLKLKELVNKRKIIYANVSFKKEKLLTKIVVIVEICYQIVIYYLNQQNSNNNIEDQKAIDITILAKIFLIRSLNIIILVIMYALMLTIQVLQSRLINNILKKPLEQSCNSLFQNDNNEDESTSLF